MKHLFNYTKKLVADIYLLLEEISILQHFSSEQKKSISAEEKVKDLVKNARKKICFLRILMHISYLEEYKGDFARAVYELDAAMSSSAISKTALKRVAISLDAIGREYPEEEAQKQVAAPSLSSKVIDALEGTMKVLEEILLAQYGLSSPISDLEEKLIHTIEALFHLPLDQLTITEKEHIEAFFNHIHSAFEKKETIDWEDAFIQCTSIMNKLKEEAGMPPNSTLEITIEEKEDEKEEE